MNDALERLQPRQDYERCQLERPEYGAIIERKHGWKGLVRGRCATGPIHLQVQGPMRHMASGRPARSALGGIVSVSQR